MTKSPVTLDSPESRTPPPLYPASSVYMTRARHERLERSWTLCSSFPLSVTLEETRNWGLVYVYVEELSIKTWRLLGLHPLDRLLLDNHSKLMTFCLSFRMANSVWKFVYIVNLSCKPLFMDGIDQSMYIVFMTTKLLYIFQKDLSSENNVGLMLVHCSSRGRSKYIRYF